MTKALIIVDCQLDFTENGSLPVPGGSKVAIDINEYLKEHDADYKLIIATVDWHQAPGDHFSPKPDYQQTWPKHCLQYSQGAAIHPAIDLSFIDHVVRKGRYEAAYSGFDGMNEDNDSLSRILGKHKIDTLDLCGLATDHCVYQTALDALKFSYKLTVLLPLCAGINAIAVQGAIDNLIKQGATIA